MNGSESTPRLVIFDGHAIIHRAYWGNKDHPLSVRRTGEVVTAVFGFANTLLSVLDKLRPTHVAVAMDSSAPTFRHIKAETYKAHRPEMPADLRSQISRVADLIEAFNIPIYSIDGFEADDVLGTLARQASEQGITTFLVTLDSDILQLVGPRVFVYMFRPFQHDTVTYDIDAVIERYGLPPARIPDLKGLKGDTSDNIPGVPGIGEKTAVKLINTYGGVAELYQQIDSVEPAKTRELLRRFEEQSRASCDLATIVTDVPVTLDVDGCRLADFDINRVGDLFLQLEFRSLLSRVAALAQREGTATAPRESADDVEVNYRTVCSAEALDEVLAEVRRTGKLAFDTETTSTNAMSAQLVGVSISWAPGQSCYIPVGHMPDLESPEQLPVAVVVERLQTIFSDPAIEKIAHNAKYDLIVLKNAGLNIDSIESDTMIAAYLLGDREIGLKGLAHELLGVQMTPISALIGTGTKQITMDQVAIASASAYAAADADMTLRIRPQVEGAVAERGLTSLYQEIELPLVSVLEKIEQTGFAVDVAVLRTMARQLTEDLIRSESDIYDSVGHHFNLGSPKQLSQVLFEELKLPPTRKTTQGFTTDAGALEALKGSHPVIEMILEYRQLAKLKSTYIDALPGMINPRTGRVHTSFSQTTAATGRLSSSDPNLQNIPVRTELGKKVRSAFVARDATGERPMTLLAADYSQIELRILAHISQEPRLLEAFRADEDIHKATAADLFGVTIAEVMPAQRNLAKTVNFAVIYGLSAMGLSTRTELSRGEAAAFIEQYFQRYPGIRRYLDDTIAATRKQGYAETLLGRRRYLPDIHSSNFNIRQGAERMATNHPIQGSNADMIKIAMIRIHQEMREQELQSHMILQVHDELIFECYDEEIEAVKDLAVRLMCAALPLSVPVKVEVKSGRNWGEME